MDDRKIYFYKNGKLLVSFEKDETIKDGYTLIPAKVLGIQRTYVIKLINELQINKN